MPRIERPAMADYGVPADLDGALPWSWASERLVANRNYWLVTASDTGRPHAMPVWGVWDRSTERFWFSCDPGSLKARNLEVNPNVVVTTDDTIEVVSIEGSARRHDGATSLCTAIAEAYAAKYENDPEPQAELAAFVLAGAMFEVTPTKGFGVIERAEEFGPRATRWRW